MKSESYSNPRYLCYVEAHGSVKPEEQLAKDEVEYPGGKMCGFIMWIPKMWCKWDDEMKHSKIRRELRNEEDHIEFDKWLKAQVGGCE